MTDESEMVGLASSSMPIQPYPVSRLHISTPAYLPAGSRLVVITTPYGPHMYVFDADASAQLGKALLAPTIQVPTI